MGKPSSTLLQLRQGVEALEQENARLRMALKGEPEAFAIGRNFLFECRRSISKQAF